MILYRLDKGVIDVLPGSGSVRLIFRCYLLGPHLDSRLPVGSGDKGNGLLRIRREIRISCSLMQSLPKISIELCIVGELHGAKCQSAGKIVEGN